MRLICYTIFLSLLCTSAFSQIQFGVKGGLGTTDVSVDELNVLQDGGGERLRVAFEDANYGVHAGIMLRIPLGETFLLQPELVFNSNSVDFRVDELNQPGTPSDIFNEKYQYLDIPLLLGARLGPLRLMAGPEGRVFVNSASDLFQFNDYDQNFDDLTISYLAGVGLDLWNITLDVRYEGSLDKFGDHITFGGQQYEFNRSAARWLFSFGVFLGR